jgi:2-iminobutanoate/2-iminopropanoate deaminase
MICSSRRKKGIFTTWPHNLVSYRLISLQAVLCLSLVATFQACNVSKPDSKTAVLTTKAPAPIGPYSQAIMKGKSLFVSGQIAINPATNSLDTISILQETRQVMENIKAVLQQAGMDFNHVVKTTIYLTDITTFGQVNEVYASYIPKIPPARETVEVRKLPRGAHIEISVIAIQD